MKKRFCLFLTAALLLSLFALGAALPASAEETLPSVYLSDNGNDENDGLTADTAVKTFERAQELLGDKGGTLLIPDVYSYPSGATYYVPYRKGASYTFRGTLENGASRFIHARKNICMNNPMTFDNLTYCLTQTWSTLLTRFNALTFTDSVTMEPYNQVDERNNYLFLYGGEEKAGNIGQNVDITLMGGTFGYVVLGCKKSEMYGDISFRMGGNAKIINRLYCGGEGISDVYGDIAVAIEGGTIGENIFCGGVNSESGGAYVTGNVSVTVTGGTFGAICCAGTYDGPVSGDIRIDLSAYDPATPEWVATHVTKATEKTAILAYGESLPAGDVTDETTDEGTEVPTNEGTDEPTNEPTCEETGTPTEVPTNELSEPDGSETEAPSAANGTEPGSQDPPEKGCSSSGAAVLLLPLCVCGTAVVLTRGRRKE